MSLVFYYLSYEGSVDIETVTDPVEKCSLEAQIQEFGQTPKQLFASAHPSRDSNLSLVEIAVPPVAPPQYNEESEYCMIEPDAAYNAAIPTTSTASSLKKSLFSFQTPTILTTRLVDSMRRVSFKGNKNQHTTTPAVWPWKSFHVKMTDMAWTRQGDMLHLHQEYVSNILYNHEF